MIKYLLILLLASCGREDREHQHCVTFGEQCHGEPGEAGTEGNTNSTETGREDIPGPQGPAGQSNIPGPSGTPGQPGSSCSVTGSSAGATIRCTDGTSAVIPNAIYVLDPCGKQGTHDEVLIRLNIGEVLRIYNNKYLTILAPGNYTTTDGTNCHFVVNTNNSVTW